MKRLLFLLVLAAGVSHSEDVDFTTAYFQHTTWEWHSPDDPGGWPRYRLDFLENALVSAKEGYSGQTESELFAQWEPTGPKQIRLRYVKSFGNDPPWRVLQGVEVVTMGAVYGRTTQNVRIRTAPRIAASLIPFAEWDYCPKGRLVRVLARTLQTERVQQWANYWYYVEITAGEGFLPRYGWMFGEFVDYSEEELRQAEAETRPWEEAEPEEEETELEEEAHEDIEYD